MKVKHIIHLMVIKLKSLIDSKKIKKYKKSIYSNRLKNIKNTKEGKRCFIIGNGPSLTTEDLELIKDEDCFACNRIYGLYKDTDWRPKYYGIQDPMVLNAILESDDISKGINECELAFLPYNMRDSFSNILSKEKVNLFYKRYISIYTPDGTHKEGFIPFSEDIQSGIYDGMSILYTFMQIAIYMGYKEIYLIGVDHSYSMKNGVVDSSQSYAKGIKPIDMTKQLPPELEILEISFREAKRYAESRGVLIKNATRGGKLEVFEREDFNSVIRQR